MKIVLNLVLVAIAAFLIYLLVDSIKEPIEFNQQRKVRETAVVDKLKDIRTCQELYRSITGEFAHDFDTLKQVLTSERLFEVKLNKDPEFPDDPDKFIIDTLFYNTMDSINSMGINLNDLSDIPFSEGESFTMQADTVTYQQTLVHVMECGASRKLYMGEWGDPKFSKYDDTYDANKVIKFGDMTAPSLSGNWE